MSDLIACGSGTRTCNLLDPLIGSEPSPEFAAMVAEEFRRRLESLNDPVLRLIAERKLACHTNQEIARELGASLRTVTLKARTHSQEVERERWVREWPEDTERRFPDTG